MGQFVASIYDVGPAAADQMKYVYFRFNNRQIGFPTSGYMQQYFYY